MIAAALQIIATAASAVIFVLVILFIGAVVTGLLRWLVPAIDLSIGLAFSAGLFVLCLASWYLFLLKITVRAGFAGLLGTMAVAALLAAAVPAGRRQASDLLRGLRSAWPVALVLIFLCAMMSALLLLPLGPDDLPLVTIGNNDIHSYIRMASYLLDETAGRGNALPYDMRAKASFDVFGAYLLPAFAAFLRQTDPVFLPEVPLVAVTALIGTFIARICRRIWRLPWILSAILGAAGVTNGLLAFAALHYYLSQLTCAALMLIVSHDLLAAAGRRQLGLATVVAGEAAFVGGVLFVYSALLFPLIVGVVLLSSWLLVVQALDERPTPPARDLAASVLRVAVGGGSLAVGLVCLAAPTRVVETAGRLAFYAQHIPGWSLGFIRPAAILGLPTFAEPAFEASAGIAREVGETGLVLAFVIGLMVLVWRRRATLAEKLLRLTPLLAFLGLLLGYLGVWWHYGASYLQWKTAVSFPVMLSFSVAGSLCYLAYQPGHRAGRFVALSVAAAFVVAASWLSIGWTLYPRAMHFPRAAAAVAAIDGMPEIVRVSVDLPNASFGDRMLVADFVRRPSLAFLQPTYYGNVQKTVHATPAEPVLRQDGPACAAADEIRLGGHYVLATSDRRPALVPGAMVAFDRPVGSCIVATGLSPPEPAGAWSNGPSVVLSFVCDCARRDSGRTVTLVAHAFIVPGVPRQRMVARVNGVPAGDWTVSDAAEHRFAIPLPGGATDTVRLDLSFPDAASPAALGLSDDRRLLAFQLIGLALAD